MSDFEVCPVGTLQRLAQAEAERDSMREILDHIPQVEAELEETSDRLHAVEAERDALRADAERYRWLRPRATSSTQQVGTPEGTVYRTAWRIVTGGSDTDIDAAIDAAKGGGNG